MRRSRHSIEKLLYSKYGNFAHTNACLMYKETTSVYQYQLVKQGAITTWVLDLYVYLYPPHTLICFYLERSQYIFTIERSQYIFTVEKVLY